MPSFKPKNAKKIIVCKKTNTTLDGKHKELLEEFNRKYTEVLPELRCQRKTIKNTLSSGGISVEERLELGDKLEEIKVAYDSLRQVQLEQMEQGDELWDYAIAENTVEAYTDYIKIKGMNDDVYEKLTSLLDRTGYVQIQESNGNMLIEELENGLWSSKSARSIRYGVMGLKEFPSTNRNGDVILEGQPFIIIKDSLMSGKTRWAKILY